MFKIVHIRIHPPPLVLYCTALYHTVGSCVVRIVLQCFLARFCPQPAFVAGAICKAVEFGNNLRTDKLCYHSSQLLRTCLFLTVKWQCKNYVISGLIDHLNRFSRGKSPSFVKMKFPPIISRISYNFIFAIAIAKWLWLKSYIVTLCNTTARYSYRCIKS